METPVARVVMEPLRNKNTNIKFMLGRWCGAAVKEGAKFYQTRALSSISRESMFHKRLAKDLPTVEALPPPVYVRKKLVHKKFSCLYGTLRFSRPYMCPNPKIPL